MPANKAEIGDELKCVECGFTEALQHQHLVLQRYRFVPRKEGEGNADLITLCTACFKKEERWTRAQAKMEEFARLAHEVKRAVDVLEDAFTGLADWPDLIFQAMPPLAEAADVVADEAFEWASMSNTELNPSDLTTFSPVNLTIFESEADDNSAADSGKEDES